MILYLDTVRRVWYDENGSEFSAGFPQIPYANNEIVAIHCVTSAPDAGTEGCDPTEWPADDSFNVSGVTAVLSSDDNNRWRIQGTLKNAVPAGSVSSVVVTSNGIEPYDIPSAGTVVLENADGSTEGIAYTSFSVSESDVTFTAASGSTASHSHAQGSKCNFPEALLCQASLSAEASDLEEGLFVFSLSVNSRKLRSIVDSTDASEIPNVKGLELQIFTVSGSTVNVIGSFLCSTFSIPIPLAQANPNPQTPATETDNVAAIVAAELANGIDLQFSVDGTTNWHTTQATADAFVRMRHHGSTGPWSAAIALPAGASGGGGGAIEETVTAVSGTSFTATAGKFYLWTHGAGINTISASALSENLKQKTARVFFNLDPGRTVSLDGDLVLADGDSFATGYKYLCEIQWVSTLDPVLRILCKIEP